VAERVLFKRNIYGYLWMIGIVAATVALAAFRFAS
jgi:hypothetical protein